MKKGFTLVELSIVLVIIGLLVGGILVGQSMINSAKVNSLVRQIQQIDVAVSNYRTRYNALPGDDPNRGNATAYGNDNGRIADQAVNAFNGEGLLFWKELYENGYTGHPFPAFADDPTSLTERAAYGKPNDPYNGVAPPSINPYYIPGSEYGNYYFLGGMNPGCCHNPDLNGDSWSTFMTYTPSEIQALDGKMDDGQPGWPDYKGKVVARGLKNGYDPVDLFTGLNQTCVNETTYAYETGNNTACAVWIAMLSGNGGTQ